jgi:hypothetical protein
LAQLAEQPGAPRIKGSDVVDRQALHRVYRDESKTAWVEMLAGLQEEGDGGEVDMLAGDQFRQKIANALLTLVPLAYTYAGPGGEDRSEVQRRSLIQWCKAFAKPGRWGGVRSYLIWCRADSGIQRIAFRNGLFGQLHVSELARLSPTRLTQLCELYGVGRGVRISGGAQRAVELTPEFVADLLAEPAAHEGDDSHDMTDPSHAHTREEVS